jgi:aminoglycoside phosphotransferase (APT) family kinase protein
LQGVGLPPARIVSWVSACLGAPVEVTRVSNLRDRPAREAWDCAVPGHGQVVLVLYKPASPEMVNASLPAPETARKCAAAMRELDALGIPTPRVLGAAERDGVGAVATLRLERLPWSPHARLEAARILARLHRLWLDAFSPELRALIERSDPRQERTYAGRRDAPRLPSRERTLVHGDFFSANLVPTRDGVRVIDWETIGLGDPMWDLGFLVGADRGLPPEEIDASIAAYAESAPVDHDRLAWYRGTWADRWRVRPDTSTAAI